MGSCSAVLWCVDSGDSVTRERRVRLLPLSLSLLFSPSGSVRKDRRGCLREQDRLAGEREQRTRELSESGQTLLDQRGREEEQRQLAPLGRKQVDSHFRSGDRLNTRLETE